MPRFFVETAELSDSVIVLTGENAAHAKVLRLKPGDAVTVCDGRGTDYRCAVDEVAAGQLRLRVDAVVPSESEPRVDCAIYMAFPKSDKLEHVVQKATELGATEIVCFPTERCVSRPDERALAKKTERWQKIAASAAEQSRRGRIPRVTVLPSYRAALARAAQCDLAVLFYENEKSRTFRSVIERAPFRTAALLTGPEGGLTEAEVALAADLGLHICTLGSRILRCETAPLCALSALMYAAGEF